MQDAHAPKDFAVAHTSSSKLGQSADPGNYGMLLQVCYMAPTFQHICFPRPLSSTLVALLIPSATPSKLCPYLVLMPFAPPL